ncbi:MAG: outer membrane beta-barrel protein [Caulobacteraceae bacterium]|nr:outer membrane beta-barrel protein [Caulobacteraceae bacterium]
MKKLATAAAVTVLVMAAAPAFAEDVTTSGSVTAWVAGTDNALLQPSNEQDDTIWGVKGNFKLSSGPVDFHGAAAATEFSDFNDESTFDWDLGADAAFDTGGAKLTFGGDYADGSEDRHSVTARRDTRHPTNVATVTAYGGLAGRMGDVEISGRVDYATADYDDDRHRIFLTHIDQDYRDRSTWNESIRATFSPDAAVSWFGEISATQVDYDQKPPFALHNRDSDGWSAVVGVKVDMTDELTGMASIGWTGRSFDEPGFDDEDDVTVHAAFDWTVDSNTHVALMGTREFRETTQAFSPIYVSTTVRAQFDHSFSAQWSISAYAQQEWADHRQVDRDDEVSQLGASLTYDFLENAGVSVTWDHAQLNSDGFFAVPEYDENRWGAAVSVRF